MKPIQCELLLQCLKDKVRESKLTYADLAKELGLSVPGIKKILNNTDVSLARAIQICQVLGIEMSDVLASAEERATADKKFTDKQIEAFIRQPELFFFYMRLSYERKDLAEIQSEHRLSDSQTFKYLKKLDGLGLIVLGGHNRFSLVDGPAARLRTTGTPLNDLKFQAARRMLDRVQKSNDGYLGGGIFFLSPLQLMELDSEVFALHDKFSKLSMANRSSKFRGKKEQFKTQTALILSASGTLFMF